MFFCFCHDNLHFLFAEQFRRHLSPLPESSLPADLHQKYYGFLIKHLLVLSYNFLCKLDTFDGFETCRLVTLFASEFDWFLNLGVCGTNFGV